MPDNTNDLHRGPCAMLSNPFSNRILIWPILTGHIIIYDCYRLGTRHGIIVPKHALNEIGSYINRPVTVVPDSC
jgi:hypothetical protein